MPSIVFFSLTTVLILSFGLAEDAFADFTPTQPNAYASYNSDTNEIQLEWAFTNSTGGPAPVTCLLKGDFWYYTNLNEKHGVEKDDNEDPTHADYDTYTLVTGFIPIHYSVVSSSPTNPGSATTAEIVPCEGSARIDIDTVMSHSTNPDVFGNPRDDLEIFLTFYVADPNGNFNTGKDNDGNGDGYRIDEVFVMYTPTDTWRTEAKAYGCGGQIGSTLYIDKSGTGGTTAIHGNNGDNCDQYIELDSNQWVDIGMNGATTIPLKGETVYGAHGKSSFPLLTLVGGPSTSTSTPTSSSTSDSGSCDDCVDPTFYYSQNRNIVHDGFRYNGYSTNVTAYHTDISTLITNTTRTNYLTLKVFDNSGTDGIEWIDIGFGSPGENISFDDSEVRIETKFSDNSVVETFVYPEEQNLIYFGNVTASVVSCGYESYKCLQMTIPHKFNDELTYPAIMVRAIDESRNDKYHYFNEGIKILGEPLYKPPTDKIFIQKYLGNPEYEWVTIDRIDRVNDIWISNEGIEFKGTDGGGFQRITTLGFDDTILN